MIPRSPRKTVLDASSLESARCWEFPAPQGIVGIKSYFYGVLGSIYFQLFSYFSAQVVGVSQVWKATSGIMALFPVLGWFFRGADPEFLSLYQYIYIFIIYIFTFIYLYFDIWIHLLHFKYLVYIFICVFYFCIIYIFVALFIY